MGLPSLPPPPPMQPCSGHMTLSSASGTIWDGPSSYSSHQACSWLINLGAPVTLTFSSFALEAAWDFVKVYDGTSSSGAILGAFSGTLVPPAVTASSGSMFVAFTADASVEADGFIGVYSSATATAAAGQVVERRSDQRSIPDMSRETITGSGDSGSRSDFVRMAGGFAIVLGTAMMLG